ncbi:MAG: hypothetical protein ACI9I0_002483 [Rhodoferax sp.]|jgi:hypothetical protein
MFITSQGLKSRNSTGSFCGEGLSEPFNSPGKLAGSGCLELTRYACPLKLPLPSFARVRLLQARQ